MARNNASFLLLLGPVKSPPPFFLGGGEGDAPYRTLALKSLQGRGGEGCVRASSPRQNKKYEQVRKGRVSVGDLQP